MSTNYYWQANSCEHCGRSDERVHICKSMTSWASMMQWVDELNCYVPTITSFAHWAQWLSWSTHAGFIVDEYGRTYDVEEFLEMAKSVPMEARSRQYDWIAKNVMYSGEVSDVPTTGKYWLDRDGYTFYGGEFC